MDSARILKQNFFVWSDSSCRNSMSRKADGHLSVKFLAACGRLVLKDDLFLVFHLIYCSISSLRSAAVFHHSMFITVPVEQQRSAATSFLLVLSIVLIRFFFFVSVTRLWLLFMGVLIVTAADVLLQTWEASRVGSNRCLGFFVCAEFLCSPPHPIGDGC